MHAWVVGLNGLIGVSAVVLLLAPPPARWLSDWMTRDGLGEDDATFTAVRGALVRMCYVGAVTFGILTMVGLVLQLKAVAAAVALAFAVIASASVRVDGGTRRSARLSAEETPQHGTRRLLVAATALAVLVVVSALLLAREFGTHSPPRGAPDFGFGVALPDVTTYSLPVIAGLSLALVVAGWIAMDRVQRRPSLTAPGTGADSALRTVSARRITGGLLGGQTVLLGITLSAIPILGPSRGPAGQQWEVDPSLVSTAGTCGLVLVAVGLLVVAAGLVASWWPRDFRARRALVSTEAR